VNGTKRSRRYLAHKGAPVKIRQMRGVGSFSAHGSGSVAERRFGHGDDGIDARGSDGKPVVIACTGEKSPPSEFRFTLRLDFDKVVQ